MAFADDVSSLKDVTTRLVQREAHAPLRELLAEGHQWDMLTEWEAMQQCCVDAYELAGELAGVVNRMEQVSQTKPGFFSEAVASVNVLSESVGKLTELTQVCLDNKDKPDALREQDVAEKLFRRVDDIRDLVFASPRQQFLDQAAAAEFKADSDQIDACNQRLLKEIEDRATFVFWTNNGYVFIDPDGDRSSFPLFFTEGASKGTAVMKRATLGAGKIEVTSGSAAFLKYGVRDISDKKIVDSEGKEAK